VLLSFDKRYEKLMADHPVAKKEMGLVLASIVQIGQLVQNSPQVNGNGTKWKQLADRAEADRHTLCKFLDGQALFTGLFHIYAATCKETRDSLHPSSIQSGQVDASQAEQNKRRKRNKNFEDECCMKKKNKTPPPTYQNTLPVATNNFFAPLRDLAMENAQMGNERNFTKTPGTNECPDKCRLSLIELTLQANIFSPQRELKRVVIGEFFRNTATGTRITTKSMVDQNVIQKFLTEKNLHFFHFTQKRINMLKLLSGIYLATFLQRTLL
jgi:hypothetical protein